MNSLSIPTHVYLHSFKTQNDTGIAFSDIYDSMETALEAAETPDPLGNDYPWSISPNGNCYRSRPNMLNKDLIVVESIQIKSIYTLIEILHLNEQTYIN